MAGWTKRRFVEKAFEKIGMASYAYDADPAELQDALEDLDAMMAEWNEDGIQLGWPQTADPSNSDLDTDTRCPRRAVRAIYNKLAITIAPGYGKQPSPRVASDALRGYQRLLAHYTKPPQRRTLTLPSGAGNRWRYGNSSAYNRFTRPRQSNQILPPENNIGFSDE